MACANRAPRRLPFFAFAALLVIRLEASCDTTRINGYTAGRGVIGNTCPTSMQEGDVCHTICGANSTSVGTIKCLRGNLHDVSLCVANNLLEEFAVDYVTKVVGAWEVSLSREPYNAQLIGAVVDGMMMPRHFVECVWLSGKSAEGGYIIKYWVIAKPGMSPDVIGDKARAFLFENSTHHQRFKAGIESGGMTMTSISIHTEPTTIQSAVLKDPWGKNVNPFGASPEGGSGLDSWQ